VQVRERVMEMVVERSEVAYLGDGCPVGIINPSRFFGGLGGAL